MLTKKSNENRNETTMFLCIDDFVPKDHLLRKIDVAVNFNFIYDLRRICIPPTKDVPV